MTLQILQITPVTFNSISDHAGMLSPSIIAKKTMNMLTGYFSQPCTDILVNQQKVENVEEFTYPGSSVHYQGDMDAELN